MNFAFWPFHREITPIIKQINKHQTKSFQFTKSLLYNKIMIRFLAKWSLEITGISMVGYYGYLTPQQRADCQGVFRSFTNSTRASSVVFRSIYDYYYELQAF